MRSQRFLVAIFILLLCGCGGEDNKTTEKLEKLADSVIVPDSSSVNDAAAWQKNFRLTHEPELDTIAGKPVSFYMNDPDCSPLAKDFYLGLLRPADNFTTDALLSLAASDNSKLRPLYRWCLEKTIDVQDGALGEHTGLPARRYVQRFPEEFYNYIQADTSGKVRDQWVSAISYSGFEDNENYTDPESVRQNMKQAIKKNCRSCNSTVVSFLNNFVDSCFQ